MLVWTRLVSIREELRKDEIEISRTHQEIHELEYWLFQMADKRFNEILLLIPSLSKQQTIRCLFLQNHI